MDNIRKARTEHCAKKVLVQEVKDMEKKDIFLRLLAEYITKDHADPKHLKEYQEALLRHLDTNKSSLPEIIGISRSTLNKILKGDQSISVNTLKAFAYAFIKYDCPLPDFHSELFETCSNCIEHRFVTKLIRLLYEENWIPASVGEQ